MKPNKVIRMATTIIARKFVSVLKMDKDVSVCTVVWTGLWCVTHAVYAHAKD